MDCLYNTLVTADSSFSATSVGRHPCGRVYIIVFVRRIAVTAERTNERRVRVLQVVVEICRPVYVTGALTIEPSRAHRRPRWKTV